MATFTMPNSRLWTPASAEFGLQTAVFESTSPYGLATQTVDMLASRWVGTLTYPNQTNAERAVVEALLANVRGKAGRISMGHPLRRVPRGTMRGTPTLAASASALAVTLNITGTGTLMAGDMLGVGGELVMVTADNPALTAVPITPPLRVAKSSGATVTWDWPRAVFMLETNEVRIPFGAKVSPSFSIDVVEVFA